MKVRLDAVAARHPSAAAASPPVLAGLSLGLEAGEQVAVIGPSGAGKTSLLHVLACALRPAAGAVQLDGGDPWSLPARSLRDLRSRLFLAPQVPPLPPRQRVVTAVLAGRLTRMGLGASLRNLLLPANPRAARDALARFDLADKLYARVDRLSGGERQRVGLARALVADASLLLVDEPLSALDPARAQQAMDALTAAARERGATLLVSMHDVPMALRSFPRILGLRDGGLVFDLPAGHVTPARLEALYAGRSAELSGPGPDPEAPPRREPMVVVCR